MIRAGKWLLVLAAGVLPGCDLINPEEPAAGFLFVEPFQLETIPSREGSASANITEAWITREAAFIGAFPLPALTPLTAMGEQQLSIMPGIRENGISSTPAIYPFYRSFETTITVRAGKSDTLRPLTRYREDARFALLEPFGAGRTTFRELQVGDERNLLRPTEEAAFEGSHAGRLVLDTLAPAVQLATRERFSTGLSENGSPVYLELNYRSGVDVVFGIIAYRNSDPQRGVALFNPGFRARNDWNKIYFNLTPLINQEDFDTFQLGLRSNLPRNDAGNFAIERAEVWLDNVKLVHF